ncbi:hypothetical protein ANCDUO_16673 [Ancylostoma duodenale]|uniref:Uncharacterized protein n=1 Tax=Ancylostoma duodenale TaxID=51022 RepID=A0A0C2CTT5_9BILA|nr:hypothetical protein ANCDUO_16673 [Ancylostoma duodenale]
MTTSLPLTPRSRDTSPTTLSINLVTTTTTPLRISSTSIIPRPAPVDRPWIKLAWPQEELTVPPIPPWMTTTTEKTMTTVRTSPTTTTKETIMATTTTIPVSSQQSQSPTTTIAWTTITATRTTIGAPSYTQTYRPMVWPPPPLASITSAGTTTSTREKRITAATTTPVAPNFSATTTMPVRSSITENIYPHDYSSRRQFNNICVRHFLGVQRLYALSAADPTWAARVLLGRTDVAAIRISGELLVTKCRQVTPTHVYTNHTINGTCYSLTPAIVDNDL